MTTLLLVEDNDLNRNMLSRRLERMDYAILLAVNGEDGVTQTRAHKPDLVLMDINMPVMDGWDALTILKADPETSDIPIVALTAHTTASDRDKASEIGFNAFAAKPIDFKALVETIEELIYARHNP